MHGGIGRFAHQSETSRRPCRVLKVAAERNHVAVRRRMSSLARWEFGRSRSVPRKKNVFRTGMLRKEAMQISSVFGSAESITERGSRTCPLVYSLSSLPADSKSKHSSGCKGTEQEKATTTSAAKKARRQSDSTPPLKHCDSRQPSERLAIEPVPESFHTAIGVALEAASTKAGLLVQRIKVRPMLFF